MRISGYKILFQMHAFPSSLSIRLDSKTVIPTVCAIPVMKLVCTDVLPGRIQLFAKLICSLNSEIGFSSGLLCKFTYPNRTSLPVGKVLPLIRPTSFQTFPAVSSISSWRYMKPPHSARHGILSSNALLIVQACSDFLPILFHTVQDNRHREEIPFTFSGIFLSWSGLNSITSQPRLSNSSRLSL